MQTLRVGLGFLMLVFFIHPRVPPLEAQEVAAPAAAPAVAEDAAPVAETLTAVKIAQDPALWPKQVTVSTPQEVSLVSGGKAIGKIKLPAGTRYDLKAVAGETVTVLYKENELVIPVIETDLLTEAEKVRLRRDSMNAQREAAAAVASTEIKPAPAPVVSQPPKATNELGQKIQKDMVQLKGNRLSAYEGKEMGNKKHILVYYSASWCGPCKAFTPDLVAAYSRWKQKYGEDFELVFFSSDHDEDQMREYMKASAMPWPAVKFSRVSKSHPLSKFGGRGIPCLVLLGGNGEVLSHSYEAEQYVGPRKVMADFERMAVPQAP
ncbi:MAG: thioredoxin-like domain-containing protein [Verrucomicrobiae bacterium]|nr:thioredoxin-like domain-containing protein [Verrucomicrobiae bacterium]